MAAEDHLSDLEQRLLQAYQIGDYQKAKSLEHQFHRLRGQQSFDQQQDPYALEGRLFDEE